VFYVRLEVSGRLDNFYLQTLEDPCLSGYGRSCVMPP